MYMYMYNEAYSLRQLVFMSSFLSHCVCVCVVRVVLYKGYIYSNDIQDIVTITVVPHTLVHYNDHYSSCTSKRAS